MRRSHLRARPARSPAGRPITRWAAPALALALAAMAVVAVLGTAPPASGAGVRSIRDILYARPEGIPLRVDVDLPAGDGPFPAVVVLHGGGWRFNDRTELRAESRMLAENGMAAFAIDYRLSNRRRPRTYQPFPAAVQDAQTAVRWIRANAARFHVDPRRIGAWGSSAGAHLASMLAVIGQGSLDEGARIRAAVAFSSAMDMRVAFDDGDPRVRQVVSWFLDCDSPTSCPDRFREASPITYVDPSDAALFFVNGAHELIPLAAVTPMDAALARSHVPHQLVVVPGTIHARGNEGKTAASLPAGESTGQAAVAWLKTWLNRTRPSPSPPTSIPPSGPPLQGGGGSRWPLVAGIGAVAVLALVLGAWRLTTVRGRGSRRVRPGSWSSA
jgi:acetyl esterase